MQRRSRLRTVAAVGAWLTGAVSLSMSAAADDPPPPRVVAAWPAGPFEVRIAFDRPVGDDVAKAAVGRSIAFDENRPTLHAKPGHQAEKADSRGSLNVAAARLDDMGRTLVLTTDPHPRAAAYSLALPVGPKPVDVHYDLTGVEASWNDGAENASPAWSGWWPALSPSTALARFQQTALGARLRELLGRPGVFTLDTLITLPKGEATVRITASAPLTATLNGEEPGPVEGPDAAQAPDGQVAVFRVESTGDPMPLTLTLKTGGPTDKPLAVRVVVRRGDGAAKEIDLTPEQTLLPWTPAAPPTPAPLENAPTLTGGDAAKGKAVFFGMEAKCSACHKVRGEGGVVGPDLSDLVGRDRKGVYRDIAEPSARIHPNFVPYTVALKDGRVLVGTVRAEGADALRVSDTEAKVTVVPRAEVEEVRSSATSIMPVGLVGVIGEERLRDLLAFLTSPPK